MKIPEKMFWSNDTIFSISVQTMCAEKILVRETKWNLCVPLKEVS